MPVTLYEDITEALSENDLKHVNSMKNIFPIVMPANTLVKAPELCKKVNHELANYYYITPVSLRKWVNFMRSNGILPILASSRGYFLSYNKETIMDQVQSLRERANSINKAADGLLNFIK